MSGWLRVGAAGLALASGAASPARAQLRATVDLGGASVRYADSVRVTATTLAPTVRLDEGPLTVLAFGSLSAIGSGGWSSQGGLALSALSSPARAARFEVGAGAGGTFHQDGTRTGQYAGRARLHAGSAARGIWVGGAAGSAWNGALTQRMVEGDIGAWAQPGNLTLVATVRPAVVGDSVRFTDFTALGRHDSRRVELSGSVGMRAGAARQPGSSPIWGSLSATVWFTPQLGIVADGGSYPRDYSQGFPEGRYFSVALRVAPHRRAWRPVRSLASLDPTARDRTRGAPAVRLQLVAVPGGRCAWRVHAPRAHRVEIMGDFADWKPLELAAMPNGWWEIVTRVTPGVHQLNVRVDGGAWAVPEGSTAEVDEFGALVGVVVVH